MYLFTSPPYFFNLCDIEDAFQLIVSYFLHDMKIFKKLGFAYILDGPKMCQLVLQALAKNSAVGRVCYRGFFFFKIIYIFAKYFCKTT